MNRPPCLYFFSVRRQNRVALKANKLRENEVLFYDTDVGGRFCLFFAEPLNQIGQRFFKFYAVPMVFVTCGEFY